MAIVSSVCKPAVSYWSCYNQLWTEANERFTHLLEVLMNLICELSVSSDADRILTGFIIWKHAGKFIFGSAELAGSGVKNLVNSFKPSRQIFG